MAVVKGALRGFHELKWETRRTRLAERWTEPTEHNFPVIIHVVTTCGLNDHPFNDLAFMQPLSISHDSMIESAALSENENDNFHSTADNNFLTPAFASSGAGRAKHHEMNICASQQ